jgi:CrcB protein
MQGWSPVTEGIWPYVLVGIGGFIGANARFVVARLVSGLVETGLPVGTFLINVSGSFVLGVVGTLAAQRLTPHSEAMRLALGDGFLGAYTTFSTFEFETNALAQQGDWAAAAINVGASVAIGFVALRAGVALAAMWRP